MFLHCSGQNIVPIFNFLEGNVGLSLNTSNKSEWRGYKDFAAAATLSHWWLKCQHRVWNNPEWSRSLFPRLKLHNSNVDPANSGKGQLLKVLCGLLGIIEREVRNYSTLLCQSSVGCQRQGKERRKKKERKVQTCSIYWLEWLLNSCGQTQQNTWLSTDDLLNSVSTFNTF